MEALATIYDKIAKAKTQSPITAPDITLLGASKGQSQGIIIPFIELGVTHFGENRVQEAYEKWPEIKKHYPNTVLHLIGPLQTNKVSDALLLFDVIQTLDREKLAEAIAKEIAKSPSVKTKKFFIQVNIGEEEQKAGVTPADTKSFVQFCRDLKLNVAGLMCIPPIDVQPAPHFALLRTLAQENNLHELSMGMSNDYETAIRMGSTCVRIGTALFGARN